MAFEYGFYNSINGDRKYNAIQISQIFDGVIMDGVFASIGDKLFTTANGGMEIAVGTGKAWFNHTWNLNTTKMVFTLPHSHAVLSRYDAVVLEVNEEQNAYGRVNAIKIVYGTPSSNAIKPTMINTQYVHQYPLAYVKINAAVEAITAADIEIVVGTTPCPFVTSVLQQTDISGLLANWDQQFNTWFNNLKAQLTDNVVANLQNQIDQCLKPTDIATTEQIVAGTNGKLVDAAGFKANAFEATYKVGQVMFGQTPCPDPNKWVYSDGRVFMISKYPEAYAVCKTQYNMKYRVFHDDKRYSIISAGNGGSYIRDGYILETSGSIWYCNIYNLSNTGFDYGYNNLITRTYYNKHISFRVTNVGSRTLSTIILNRSVKNRTDVYLLFYASDNRKLSLIELKNGDWADSTRTEFYRDLNSDNMGTGVNLNRKAMCMAFEDDTCYIYTLYSNELYYFSFTLDRVNKELRLKNNVTKIPITDPSGTAHKYTEIVTPAIYTDSGDIVFGVKNGATEIALLKITNKNTCSSIVYQTISTTEASTYASYSTTYWYLSSDHIMWLIGTGVRSTDSKDSYGAVITNIHANLSNGKISLDRHIPVVANRSQFNNSIKFDLYKQYLSGGSKMVLTKKDNSVAIYVSTISNINGTMYLLMTGGAVTIDECNNSIYFSALPTFETSNITNSRLVYKHIFGYGYLSNNLAYLSDVINDRLVYYPEFSTPIASNIHLGLHAWLKVKS